MANIFQGDVSFADLDPTMGYEQVGRRSVLVISTDAFNRSPLNLILILPITTTLRLLPSRVSVMLPDGGLTRPSAILCEGLRSVSQQRLERRFGSVGAATLEAVQERLWILMDL